MILSLPVVFLDTKSQDFLWRVKSKQLSFGWENLKEDCLFFKQQGMKPITSTTALENWGAVKAGNLFTQKTGLLHSLQTPWFLFTWGTKGEGCRFMEITLQKCCSWEWILQSSWAMRGSENLMPRGLHYNSSSWCRTSKTKIKKTRSIAYDSRTNNPFICMQKKQHIIIILFACLLGSVINGIN